MTNLLTPLQNNGLVSNELYVEMQTNHIKYANELKTQLAYKQAQVDALMLEYCPDKMTTKQIKDWGESQKPIKEDTPEFIPTHRHYKGGLYKVLHTGKMEHNLEEVVIYTGKEGDVWVRPLTVFNEKFTAL